MLVAIRPDGRTSLKVGLAHALGGGGLGVAIRPDGRTSLKGATRLRRCWLKSVAIRPDGRTSLKVPWSAGRCLRRRRWLSDLMVGLR